MSIPEDVMKTARAIGDAWFGAGHHDSAALAEEVARAIMAEREAAKTHWLAWHAKRSEISRKHWLRASKAALAGDTRELRNRVELAEADPVEVVLSDA